MSESTQVDKRSAVHHLLFDGELRGFGRRVTAAGGKAFLAQYIRDRVVAVGLDDRFCPPRQRHRWRAPWLHANDLDPRGQAFTHACRHGAASERNQHGVYRSLVLDGFDASRPDAFTGIEVFAVLNQKRAFDVSHPPRQTASIIKVAVDNPYRRAQCADTFQLVGVSAGASHDRYGNPSAWSAVG
jgi:hypothetical protein